MARPKKKTDERLSSRLPTTQCRPELLAKARVDAARAGMPVTAYIRELVEHGQIIVQENRYDFQTVNQIKRIGVNINQQMVVLHATGGVPPELTRLWGKLETVLDRMIEKI